MVLKIKNFSYPFLKLLQLKRKHQISILFSQKILAKIDIKYMVKKILINLLKCGKIIRTLK